MIIPPSFLATFAVNEKNEISTGIPDHPQFNIELVDWTDRAVLKDKRVRSLATEHSVLRQFFSYNRVLTTFSLPVHSRVITMTIFYALSETKQLTTVAP